MLPRPASPVEELAKLADMLEKGLLTREEFDLMKAKLIDLQT
jgi:putative oligomerization/nucleic acid binding protein